jgi:hypothetical protein
MAIQNFKSTELFFLENAGELPFISLKKKTG